jgi:hypothetical protein
MGLHGLKQRYLYFTVQKYSEVEINWACSTNGRDEKLLQNFVWKPAGNGFFGTPTRVIW